MISYIIYYNMIYHRTEKPLIDTKSHLLASIPHLQARGVAGHVLFGTRDMKLILDSRRDSQAS